MKKDPICIAKRARVERFMKAHQIKSVKAWADSAKISDGAIRNWWSRPDASMTIELIQALAKAAGVSDPEMTQVFTAPQTNISGDEVIPSVATRNDSMQSSLREMPYLTGERNLPVRGRRGDGEGFFIDMHKIAGYEMRPFLLAGVEDAYCVEIQDRAMVPALKPKKFAWVNPLKTADEGDDVLVRLKDGRALIRNLKREGKDHLVLTHYMPVEKDTRILRSDIAVVHVIVGSTR